MTVSVRLVAILFSMFVMSASAEASIDYTPRASASVSSGVSRGVSGGISGRAAGSTIAATSTASSAFAINYDKADEAELCDSFDRRYRVVRVFSNPFSFFIAVGEDPRVEPEVKEGYSHVQEAGGVLYRAPVSSEIFELMAEPFGGILKPRDQWQATFEKVFVGKITVYDATGTLVVTFEGQCNTASVQFK